MNEYSIPFNEQIHTAEYEIIDNTVIVYLPDGSIRETTLNKLKPETAVHTHLRSYVENLT